jgi:phosphatidylglycerophosphate synthase
VLCEYVFRPAAHPLVVLLARLRVAPPAVVLAATATGLAAAAAIARGELVLAALLVQVKTLLDNADGQLARRTGRVSVFGRYLDAESDLLVDAALLAALGWLTGRAVLAVLAYVLLTLVLAVNFDLELLYRRERGEQVDPQPAGEGAAGVLERAYAVVYGPLDRLVTGLVEWRLGRAGATAEDRLLYHDAWTVGALANLGLSTQMAVLGVLLAVGRPSAFLWWTVACGAVVVLLFVRRDLRLRRAGAARLELCAERRSGS